MKLSRLQLAATIALSAVSGYIVSVMLDPGRGLEALFLVLLVLVGLGAVWGGMWLQVALINLRAEEKLRAWLRGWLPRVRARRRA